MRKVKKGRVGRKLFLPIFGGFGSRWERLASFFFSGSGGGQRQCGVMKAHSTTIATFGQEQGGSNSLLFGRKKDQVVEKKSFFFCRGKNIWEKKAARQIGGLF